jgi:hypothetical protein
LDQKLKKEKQYFTFENFELFNVSSTLGLRKPPSFGSLIKAKPNHVCIHYEQNQTH